MAYDFVARGATVKERPIVFDAGSFNDSYTIAGVYNPHIVPYSIVGRQFTASKDHHIEWKLRNQLLREKRYVGKPGKPRFPIGNMVTGSARQRILNLDIGGSFWSTKNSYYNSHKRVYGYGLSAGPTGNYYWGPACAFSSSAAMSGIIWPSVPSYEVQQLNALAMGGAAIADTVPTAPVTSLANFLGEIIRDGIPDMIGRTIRREGFSLDSLSKEYLNYEFGWKPLVSDLTKLAKIILKSRDLIDQYERDSGRNISRRRTFPTQRSVSVSTVSGVPMSPGLRTGTFALGANTGLQTKTRESITEYWFSATYSYFLNFGDDKFSKFQRAVSIAEKLLGFEITPEVVWNLTPWTWLTDWFVNIGDVFTNASAFLKDGLIMRRGYLMCENSTVDTYTLQGIAFKSGSLGTLTQSFGTHSKLRQRAYPWGFGLNLDAFTPRQWAILSALGITRSGLAK